MTKSLTLSLALLGWSVVAFAEPCATPPSMMAPPPPGAYTHTAHSTGNWDSPQTWKAPESQLPGQVPTSGAIVHIPAGIEVTVKTQEAALLRHVQVEGTLRFWIHGSTRLYVDTLVIDHTGKFVMGNPINTVKPVAVNEVVFTSWDGAVIDRNFDPEQLGRGLIAMGEVKIYGDPKTHMVPMTADVPAGEVFLTLDSAPNNWKVGDEVVITGSYFSETTAPTSSRDEVRTITAIDGASLILNSPLTYDHIRPRADLRLHVANLTRNVIFRSASATKAHRGHVMLMHSNVDIRHAAFLDLGRTDKSQPLDDFTVQPFGTPLTDYSIDPNPNPTNRRGRYSLHFHLNGIQPGQPAPSKVENSVVRRTIGWGFVNHSSHVDFTNNVAHDFVGAGFVTEFGDELGTFANNVAIRGIGNGEYRPVRIVFENPDRPQPLADFAFSGDGFWFQGPAIRAKNNVASGCDGAGMIFFTTGSPNPNDRFESSKDRCHDRYRGFPRSAVASVYAGFPDLSLHVPRHWSHDSNKLVIADLPILEMDGLESYGNLVGFRLRFNNHDAVAWYGEAGFAFNSAIVGVTGPATLMRQTVKNLKLWNNEQAFSQRYVANTDWQDVDAINRLDQGYVGEPKPSIRSAWVGGEMFHALQEITFSNLKIDGYEVASRLEGNGIDATGEITYLNPPLFNNFLLEKTLVPAACATPVVSSVMQVGSDALIHLQSDSSHLKYLVRFRGFGDHLWQWASGTTGPITLPGIQDNRSYTYQVTAACNAFVNGSTKPGATSFYTSPTTFTFPLSQ